MREYVDIVHPDESGGYWTEVHVLPGCGSQGETIEVTKDAIEVVLETMRTHGRPLPEEKDVIVKVQVEA